MATTGLRIGIVGCYYGRAAKAQADHLLAVEGVSIVGCADADLSRARAFASHIPAPLEPVPAFEDHSELLRQTSPDALIISTPNMHYRPAMDGLQAGCHLLLMTPLSTNVQEAWDIVSLAGARDRKVGLAHRFRHAAPLIRAKEMLAAGEIGRLRIITCTLAVPWPESPELSSVASLPIWGDFLAALLGCDWVDALLWTSCRSADLVSAIQSNQESEVDLVTAASIRLEGGVMATIAISGTESSPFLEWKFHGESGRLRATMSSLELARGGDEARPIPLTQNVLELEANFVSAIRDGTPLCCPASEALPAVRVLEAIARSAVIGQSVVLA
jgi:predicted dehydrogenase